MRKYPKHPIVQIEDMQEPFAGNRRKNLVPLSDAEPDIAAEWLYSKNAGWGLSTLFPTVAAEWHPKKNGKLTASDVTSTSGKRAWWLCCHQSESANAHRLESLSVGTASGASLAVARVSFRCSTSHGRLDGADVLPPALE